MALNSINKEALSFKKLFGKAHTQFSFAIGEEGLTSNVQIASSTVFSEPINPLPVSDAGLTSFGDTDGVVEKIRFEIDIIPDTLIGTNQSQGYRLKLPAGYSGELSGEFSGGTYLYEALGKLQIIPKLYGQLAPNFTTEYDPVLRDGNFNQISTLNTINWNLDNYNGILFVQNPPSGYDTLATRPQYLDAYLYVGQYLDQFSGGTAGETASGERIEKDITQTSHGFVIGDVLASTGGTYIKALALETAPEALGIVTVVDDVDNFTLTYAGYSDLLSGMTDSSGNPLSGDSVYYLSDVDEGKLTPEAPVTAGDIVKPMLYVIQSGISGNIFQVRGDIVTTGGTGSGGDGVTNLVNSGSGSEVGVGITGDNLELRTIVGSGGTTVTQFTDEIVISSNASSNRTVEITTSSTVNISNMVDNVFYLASGTTEYVLPSTPSDGMHFTFADGDGNAFNSDIVIQGNGKNIIDDTQAFINTSYGSITLEYNGVFWSVTSFVQ